MITNRRDQNERVVKHMTPRMRQLTDKKLLRRQRKERRRKERRETEGQVGAMVLNARLSRESR